MSFKFVLMFLLQDVREFEEFHVSHLSGAIHVKPDLSRLEDVIQSIEGMLSRFPEGSLLSGL